MKHLNVVSFVIYLLLISHVQGENFGLADGTIFTGQETEVVSPTENPWGSSIILAASGGIPQGFRAEWGYRFSRVGLAALTFGIGDQWSNDPGEGSFGVLLGFLFPVERTSYTPYLLFGAGGTIALFGGSDDYKSIHLGTAILTKIAALKIRPELLVVFTSKHISGGSGLFGSTPEVRENDTRLGFNLGIELDFAQLF